MPSDCLLSQAPEVHQNVAVGSPDRDTDSEMLRQGFRQSEAMDLQIVSIGICAMNKKVWPPSMNICIIKQ